MVESGGYRIEKATEVHNNLLSRLSNQKTVSTQTAAEVISTATGESWGSSRNGTITEVTGRRGFSAVYTFDGQYVARSALEFILIGST